MTTARTLVTDAMIEIGAIGTVEQADADDAALGLRILNRMIDAWATKGLYAYHVATHIYALAAGDGSVTVGSGGDIDTPRPVRVETGGFTRIGGIDRPLRIATRDQWGQIGLKTLDGAWPEWVYYEAASPIGALHFWPQGACEVHVPLQEQLTQFADLNADYALPPGYDEALMLSLAEKLCRPFGRPVAGVLKADASNARRAVKAVNAQVPELTMPCGRVGGCADFLAG